MARYIILNVATGFAWPAHASEARMYASDELAAYYSVFRVGGSGVPLNSFDIY